MPGDQVEEIKSKINIVDLIGSYLELKKAGANMRAVCPFHPDKDPSLMVSPERQTFKCFGCDKGGDIFTFVEEMEGVDFPEALRILAERAGVKLKRFERKFYDKKKLFLEINEMAAKFYHHILTKDKSGKKALLYLKKRKIDKDLIDEFEIGYAPDSWESTSKFLKSKEFNEGDLKAVGLSLPGKRGIYDRFRGRIMFPIKNSAGSTVGFSGRLLNYKEGMKVGKYINSPDSFIYRKSELLFGLDKAKSEIRNTGYVMLVEGQTDVILAHSAGFKNTVASSGTAVTIKQLELLRRLTDRIYIALDQDPAGFRASKTSIDQALTLGFSVRIVTLPRKYKDIAEAVAKDKRILKKAAEKAKDVFDFYFKIAFRGGKKNLSVEYKKKISRFLLTEIKRLSDPVAQGEYIARLAKDISIEERFLFEALKKIEEKRDERKDKELPKKEKSLEGRLIALLFVFPSEFSEAKKVLNISDFEEEKIKSIYKRMIILYNKDKKIKKRSFRKKLSESEKDLLDLCVFSVEEDYEESEEEAKVAQLEISEIIKRLKEKKNKTLKEDFIKKISLAEKEGKKKEVKEIIKKFQEKIINKN